jgi:hypothetical protein
MSERNSSAILFLLCFLIFAEFLSWVTASWPGPCLLQEAHEAGTHGCPVLHGGVGILIERLFEFAEQHDKGIVALFTIVLAISTIGLWLATLRLWDAGERQLKLIQDYSIGQSEDMKASVAVAQQAAEAATISADTAQKSFTLLERPYVIPDHVEGLGGIIYFGNPSGSASFRIGNYGKVPAIVHRVGASFRMIELPVTREKLREPNYGPGQAISEAWTLSMVLPEGKTHILPTFYVPHGMRNVEIEFFDDDRRARPKTVAQHGFFLAIIVEYEDAVTSVMRENVSLWKYGLEGFTRYDGSQYNYERVREGGFVGA